MTSDPQIYRSQRTEWIRRDNLREYARRGIKACEAKYLGTCSYCEQNIMPGEIIVRVDGAWNTHGVCNDDREMGYPPGHSR